MPTSTNLGLVTPASTDYVTAGATAMQTLANGVDAYWAALTTYTPTLTNVTTGTVSGRYRKMGKLGFIYVYLTAGTATGAGNITISLPAGWTSAAIQSQPITASNSAVVFGYIGAGATAITITKDAAGTAFAATNTVAAVRAEGWIWLA